ncbi:MAG: Zn-binding domain-containing protein, partial [Candidatus Heimdallarchaeota archaeon]
GLTGAIQRIGRIRFEDDLDETRYFIFVFDPENEKDGYFLANPDKLAEQLIEAKLPPLIFSRDNFRITQGFLLLAVAYGVTNLDDLISVYCNTITDQITQEKMNKVIRQVITFLIANGILVLTDNYINVGSYVELALFLWNYNLRAIPPKWSVKKDQERGSIFTIDGRKVLREALPGNLLINDGQFWSVKTIDQRRKEINVVEITLHQKPIDVSQIEKNKCFSPEFTFGRFTQEISLQKMTIQYGDLQIVQKPSVINSYHPVTGFLRIDLKTENMKVPYSDIVFTEKSTGLVISFPEDVLRDVLKHFYFERFHFLRLISKVLLLEVTRELNISHKELVSSLSWKKGQEAIAIYDLAGPSGNSQKIFLHMEELLHGLRSKLVNCDCSSGCGACFGDLTKIFQYNPKTFLLKWLEKVLK